MNTITMPSHGILTVRMYVAIAPTDEYGRMRGSWRTLMRGYYSSPDEASKALDSFHRLNPHLETAEIDAQFAMSMHL